MHVYIGFPLMFQQPVFLCRSGSGEYNQCSQMQACQTEHFLVDRIRSANSIALMYDLYCDRIQKYQFCIFLSMMCSLVGGTMMMCLQMSRLMRYRIFAISTLLIGIIMFMISMVPLAMASLEKDTQVSAIIFLFSLNSFF